MRFMYVAFALVAVALVPLITPACRDHLVRVEAASTALTEGQCAYFAVGGKTNVCHYTGSARKPYAILRLSEQGCVDGHAAHDGDYVAYDDPTCNGQGCFPDGAPFDGSVECCEGLTPKEGYCRPTVPPPQVAITTPHDGQVTGSMGSISMTADAPVASLICTIDLVVMVACELTSMPFSLETGTHTFTAQGFDAAGNGGPIASVTWFVDADAPLVTNLGSQDMGNGQVRVNFELADDSVILAVYCRIDGGAFSLCGAGETGEVYYDVPSGTTHLVEVYAADEWGNEGISTNSSPPPSAFANVQFTTN